MSEQGPAKPALDLVIQPRTDRYDPDDDRWQGQVADLYADLRREVGGVRRKRAQVEGTKGGVDTVILALGSAGAFTATVEYLRAWLGRDRSRSLEVTWTADGREQKVSVRGEAIDQSALRTIAEAAASRIGEESWPMPPTGPS